MKIVFSLLLLLLFSVNSVLADISIYADYDYSNLTYFSEGVNEVSGTLVNTSTKYQGDLNSTRVGAYIGQPGESFLFGVDFLYGQGSTPGTLTVGSDSLSLAATTTLENARVYAGYKLHPAGDGQLRLGYGYERVTINLFDIIPQESKFNYLFIEYRDDMLRNGKSSVQADVALRYNFLSKATTYSPNYNETIFFDGLESSFGIGVSLPVSYGFNDNINLTITPYYSYNKRGLGTSPVTRAGEQYVLSDATFTEYGMSCGVKLSF